MDLTATSHSISRYVCGKRGKLLETRKAYITKAIWKHIDWPREHLGTVTIYKMITDIQFEIGNQQRRF